MNLIAFFDGAWAPPDHHPDVAEPPVGGRARPGPPSGMHGRPRVLRLCHRIARGLLVGLVAAGVTLTVANPASASTTCSNKYNAIDCTDPYATHCAGSGASYWVVATTPLVDSGGGTGGYVQLWYSGTCGTNWTRVVLQPPCYQDPNTGWTCYDPFQEYTRVTTTGPRDGPSRYTEDVDNLHSSWVYSMQLYSPDDTACAQATVYMDHGTFHNRDTICV